MMRYVQNRITDIAIEYGDRLTEVEKAFLLETDPDEGSEIESIAVGCHLYPFVMSERMFEDARKSLSVKGMIEDNGSYVRLTGRGSVVQEYLYAKEVDYELNH